LPFNVYFYFVRQTLYSQTLMVIKSYKNRLFKNCVNYIVNFVLW
jgi:hypothetical protein